MPGEEGLGKDEESGEEGGGLTVAVAAQGRVVDDRVVGGGVVCGRAVHIVPHGH